LEAGEFAAEFAETLPALIAIFHVVQGIEVRGKFGDGDAGEVFKEVAGFCVLKGCAGFGDALDAGFAGLVSSPVLMAAEPPIRKVGGRDWFVIVFLAEEVFGFGQGI